MSNKSEAVLQKKQCLPAWNPARYFMRKEIITKTVEKFEVPRKRIRELYKEWK